jgi:hypothetical protein
VRKKTGRNLNDHHYAGYGYNDASPAFALTEVMHEMMRMLKAGTISPVHARKDTPIIARSAQKPARQLRSGSNEAKARFEPKKTHLLEVTVRIWTPNYEGDLRFFGPRIKASA